MAQEQIITILGTGLEIMLLKDLLWDLMSLVWVAFQRKMDIVDKIKTKSSK